MPRDTRYAQEIETAQDDMGQRIERILVKEKGREEIRFSWWPDGKFVIRPLDIPEDELLPLFRQAISKGVFSETFLDGLRVTLCSSAAGQPKP